MTINKRSLTFALMVFMLAIEGVLTIASLLNGNSDLRYQVFWLFGLHDQSAVYTYLTYAFLHAGLLHVGMNMFVFLQVGEPCERAMGKPKYALFSTMAAVMCGAGAMWMASLWRGDANFVLVGYSGVIFAYMGVVIRMAIVRAKNKRKAAMDLARRNIFLIAYVFVPFFFPSLPISGEAHLIGFIFGYLSAPLFLR